MPTTFIALQCFQCSTMQVKQQKKSSNKWICVVCNEKQSVRKVFAQSSMARDLRKFVQNFNMSRDQLSTDQTQVLQTSDSPTHHRHQKIIKRNDWSEYVDDDDDQDQFCHLDEQGDDELEPLIVTEMPKAPLMVKDYSCESKKPIRPLFLKRSDAKRHKNSHHQDLHVDELEQTSCGRAETICSRPKRNHFPSQIQDNAEKPFAAKSTKGVSKWTNYVAGGDQTDAIGEPTLNIHTAKGRVSKWSSFITEENDDCLESESWVHISQRGNDPLESSTSMNDQRVEDDIHPDFI